MLRHIHRKAPVLKSLFNKLYQKETPARVFCYEYCKIFEKNFLIEHRRWLLLAFTIPFEIIIEKTFQLYSLLRPILACDLEKLPLQMVFKKGIFKNFRKFGRKNLRWSLFSM